MHSGKSKSFSPSGQMKDAVRSLTRLLWFVLASLQTPLGAGPLRCVYQDNMHPHTLLNSDPTLKWCRTTQTQGQALISAAVPQTLAPWLGCCVTSWASLGLRASSSNTNTLWLLNHKLSVDFIDLAVNQLVNYLISEALWVSAELPSSLQCCQAS